MIQSGIYRINCVPTGRMYIGSSVHMHKRWTTHLRNLRNGTHTNPQLLRAFKKHGEQAFVFSVVESALKADLTSREQFWMDSLQAVDLGFNLCRIAGSPDGRQRKAHTEETKAKIRAKRALQIITPESQIKRVAKLLGVSRPQYVRDKLSAAHKGVPLSAEHCAAIARVRTGTKATDEARARMSAAHTGKVRTPEHCAALSASLNAYYAKGVIPPAPATT